MNSAQIAIHWFRRDLRLHDNAALYHALKSGLAVMPVFIFDTEILSQLDDSQDKRIEFIHQALGNLHTDLIKMGSSLLVYYGKPAEIWGEILAENNVNQVFANHDYEPYAKKRDSEIATMLAAKNIGFHTFKDQCIFEKSEVVKDDGKPYTIFTPYSRKWKSKLNAFYLKPYPTEKYFTNFIKIKPQHIISLHELGFESSGFQFPDKEVKDDLIHYYEKTRDIPSIPGTSRLSVHLRFGTVSIRALANRATQLSEVWLNELIWRDFYMMILWHFPHVVSQAFKHDYDRIVWRNNEEEFSKWCEGKTGYPIVDAGMRELKTTGFMHNRVRMVTASFLTKHLLVDWRWGEAYFAQKLLDYDLSANNGGWQWAAGSGCDAAPYFRVFNPSLQTKKFDAELKYIKKWVPEINDLNYQPIVVHEFARERVLRVYKEALSGKI